MEKSQSNRLFIGIDPGKSGGMAYINENEIEVDYFKCKTAYDLHTVFKIFKGSFTPKDIHIYVEKVWSFPKDSNKASFTFGKNMGMWESLLDINGMAKVFTYPIRNEKDCKKKTIKRSCQ